MNTDLQKKIDNSIKELVEIKKEAGKSDFLKNTIIGVVDHLSKDGDEDSISKCDPIEYAKMKEAINEVMKEKKFSIAEVADIINIFRWR